MISTRAAREADIDAIAQLGKDVQEFAVSDQTITFWPKEILENAIDSDDTHIIVAEDESKQTRGLSPDKSKK